MAERKHSQQRSPLIERQRDEVIAYDATGPVRAGNFIDRASSLANRLPDRRFVINLHADRFDYLLSFCAAIIAGQCTLMPPNRQPSTLEQLRETYPDSYVTAPEDGVSDPDQALMPGAEGVRIPAIRDSQLCAIAFTSGSTGAPQPNEKFWRTLRDGSFSNRQLLLGDESRTVNVVATVPAQHMWGMEMSILLPMFANVAASHRMPFFPQDIADAIAAIPCPRALVSTPFHLETLLKSGVRPLATATIYTATAPLSRDLARSVEDRFSTSVAEVFGCTESGILATRNTSTETLWQLADAFELQADPEGIRIVAEHLSEKVILPDVVELTGDHRFRWIGRQQDMINIAGKRGSLADLNRRLRAIPGVRDGVVFLPDGRGDRLAALVVAPELPVSDILGQLKSQLEPLFLPRPVCKVPGLPRQETGKLSARAVQELFDKNRKPDV